MNLNVINIGFVSMVVHRFTFIVLLSILSVSIVHASALNEAVSAYKSGNFLTAKRIFAQLATEGRAVAQRYLGEMYDKGQGGPKDYAKAVEWYKKAAKQNDSQAQYLLGVKYANGHGVPADQKLAYAWFAIAFNNGYEKAASPLRILNKTLPMPVRQEALQLATKQLSELP